MLTIRTKDGRSRPAWSVGSERPGSRLTISQLLDIEAIGADGEEFDYIAKKFPEFSWQFEAHEGTWFGDMARTIVANL